MKTHLALVQPKKGDTTFTKAVLPYKPPIDKIYALQILQAKNLVPIEGVAYWTSNDCPPEQFSEWTNSSCYPIDIGDRKYHLAGVRSASEFVVKEFGIELSAGSQKLLDLINENNKSGKLKNYKFAVAHMLRELYELTDDEDFHIEVIMRAADVIQMCIAAEDGKIVQSEEGFSESMQDLIEHFAGCNNSPLTLGRYVRDLWLAGFEPTAIREKVSFWTERWAEVQARLAEGRETLAKLSPVEDQVAGTKVVVLKTDNRFLSKAAIKSGRWGIRIIVQGSGHTVISTNGYDLGKLHGVLQKIEPGKWYYQAKMGAMINGGPQYVGTEPTAIGWKQLIGLMKMHVQPKKKV